jgi:hypothetical protein
MSHMRLLLASILCTIPWLTSAMVVDNRYFPLFPKPYVRTPEKPSRFRVDLLFMTAEKGYGDREEDIGLPELFGRYDQGKESQAMVKIGLPSPLLDEWRGFDIKWRMQGKLQAQGVAFYYDQAITEHLSVGASWLFMHADAWHDFFLDDAETNLKPLTATDRIELDLERRQMNQIIGVEGSTSNQSGFGDIDLYVRWSVIKEYFYKFRRMDIGLKGGLLVPTGVMRDINRPSSVPFGGDGLWGLYATAEGEFELKEDLIAGFMLWVGSRFKRVKQERVSIVLSNEPQQIIENSLLYGVLVAPIQINPGVTVMASPYVALENIRAGLGFRLRYTLVTHEADDWIDRRPIAARTAEIPRASLREKLRWSYDYVSLTVFYDFGKVNVDQGMSPTLGLTWDIPALLLKGENISKTHQVSLNFEIHF